MILDNRVFNVNGEGSDGLLLALKLAFLQNGKNTTCKAWKQTKDHGLILLWSKNKDDNALICPLTAEQILPTVEAWLESDFAKSVTLSPWCEDADHDGHNNKGWQVYCEDWGYVGGNTYSICAIKPAYMWCGK